MTYLWAQKFRHLSSLTLKGHFSGIFNPILNYSRYEPTCFIDQKLHVPILYQFFRFVNQLSSHPRRFCWAVEHSPRNQGDLSSNPAGFWAFLFLLYLTLSLSCASLTGSLVVVWRHWFSPQNGSLAVQGRNKLKLELAKKKVTSGHVSGVL